MKINPFKLAREVSEKRQEKVFLASFWFNFRLIAFGAAAALPVLWMVKPDKSLTSLLTLFASYVFALCVAGVPGALSLKWLGRVRVAADGIHGGTFWSTPVYMTWAEVESVEPRTMLAIPYLRVKSFRESCPTLWLPCSLADPEAFKQCIVENTSPAHPLRRSVENGNSAQGRIPSPQI